MSSNYPPYSRSPPPGHGRERSGGISPFSHYLSSPHEEAYVHYHHQPAHFHTSAFSHQSSAVTSPTYVRTMRESASSSHLPTHSPQADQYSSAQYPYTRHQYSHQNSSSHWASPGSNLQMSPKYPSPYGGQQTVAFQFPSKYEEHKYAYSQATSPLARSPQARSPQARSPQALSPQARSPDQRSSPVPFSNRHPHNEEGYVSPTHEKNPYSILDHHREYGQQQARPKPTMADAVAQALNAHPHAVSGYLVMNNFNQKRSETSASHYSSQPSTVGADGKLFAFSRPAAGSALAAVNKSSLALARVLTRAQNVTHHRSAPSGEFIRATSNPGVNTGGGAFYRSAQEFGKTSFQQLLQRNDTLRAAGASSVSTYPSPYPLSTGASPRTDFESHPIDALSSAGSRTTSPTHISMPVLHFPPTHSISHITAKPRAAYPNMSPRLVALSNPGERSARRAALEAENLETERRRAERKRQAEEDAARVAHEVQLRRAERLRQEQLEDARIEAERQERRRKEDAQLAAIEADLAFKRGIAEGMETARRKAQEEERERRERELRDEEHRRANQHRVAPLIIPTPVHNIQPIVSPNSQQLEEARRQRRQAEEAAALESEAAMKRAREERRRKIEEEDRLAEEEAAKRREERRKKAEEDALAEEKRRNEKLPSYAQPTKASQAATADTHSTAAQAREDRKKKLAAEAAAAEEEAQKARAERRRKQEEAFAAEEAELERKRAARLAQAAEEENTLKQRMEAAKELKEKLRAEEEQASKAKADREQEKAEREKKAAEDAEERERAQKSAAAVVAVKDDEPPSQETSPAKKSITVDSAIGAGSSSPSSTSNNISASLDAVRSDMKAIKSFLSLPTTTLLPRLQTTGQIADLNEKELSVLVECGRKDPSDPICHSLEYLEKLQNNPGTSLTYLNVVELCKELLELRKNCSPCFGIEFQDRATILKSHAGRAYASWIVATDRDKLFEYLASPECTLFATNVKLSNKTLDSLLTEGGSVDTTIERCKDFCTRALQFQSGQELIEALRAIRVWKAGNMNGAALISPAVMASYAPSARGDPSSVAPLQVLLADSSTIPSSNRSIGPTELLTPKSKTKNQFVAPSWITAQDRDNLFEFLASPESTLFSSNVKLSNRTLNMLLAEGGSAEKTIAICRYFNGQGRQFMSAPALIQAVRQAVAEPPADFVKPSVATADNLIPNPVAPSTLPLPVAPQAPVGSAAPLILPMGVAPPPIKASWITDKERDELFNYLSDPSCMLFSVNVKLSNKTLDAFLTEGGSLIETIAYCKQLNDSGNQYTSTTGLLEAVKLVRIQREKAIADAVTARNVLSARPPMPVGGLEPISETEGTSERDKKNEPAPSNRVATEPIPEGADEKVSISVIPPTPAKGAVPSGPEADPAALAALAAKLGFTPKTATWITASDRDRIFDVLAAPECLLFAVNVKLSNKALDSLLVAGGSTDDTIRICNLLNDQQKQYNTVGELIVGIEEQRALEESGSSAAAVVQTAAAASSSLAAEDAEAKRIRELEERQAERKKKRASSRNTADANGIAAATAAAKKEDVPAPAPPAARLVGPPSQPLTAETITAADRDTLFALLANPDTQLFSQDVKLNNKALDRMLLAGTSLDLTTMYCHEFHHSGLQFSTIDDLCAAIEATHDAAAQHKATLFEFLQSHQAHIFTLEAFAKSNGNITHADIDELYLKGQSGLYTFSHVERIHSLNHRAASVEELATKVHEVDQNMNAQHEADTQAVEKYLSQPTALKLFPLAAELSPVDHIHLAASGRQSLYAPSRSVEYMEKLALRGMSYDTLPDLMTALHHGISNPNTARDIYAEPLTARNFLDDENDFDESEMKDLIKVDIAANALAKVNAAKGEARAPSGAIPIPQIPPLPKEAENRRHESALARIAADTKEDEDRIRANKTAKKAQLVAIFKAKDLPKIDTIGSCDGYLEFYRYRAYQDQVTAAVWEQMKNNLWQKVFKTDVVKDTLNPVWPAVIWQVESICSGEYDRPILVKAFGWKRGDNGGEYIGEFVTTLREILDRSKSQLPFEILNESTARKNPRSYKHSGLLYIQKAEVKIPRSIVAIRTIVSAVQNKVPSEDPRPEGRDRDVGATPVKIMQPSLTKGWGHMAGMGCNQYVYSECLAWFVCKGEKLDKMDTFGESDPFIQVCRLNPAITLKDGVFVKQPAAEDFIKVYETEVIEHTLNPEFRAFALTMKELCTGNILAPLLIKVLDWNKAGSPELIGEFYVDLYTLVTKGPTQDCRYALINPAKQSKSGYKNSGALSAKVKLLSKYELTSQDPKLVEELVVRAPFLLGWQPGLELKNLQKGKMGKKAAANRTATSSKATDLKLKMQEQSAQGFASMAGRASKKF